MVIAEEKIKKLRVLGIKMDQNKTPNGLPIQGERRRKLCRSNLPTLWEKNSSGKINEIPVRWRIFFPEKKIPLTNYFPRQLIFTDDNFLH